MNDQQPSTVTSDTDVTAAIFPDDEYRDDEPQNKPPVLWIEALPIRLVPASKVITVTTFVPVTTTGYGTEIVPEAANNTRRKVIIVASGNAAIYSKEQQIAFIDFGASGIGSSNGWSPNIANAYFEYTGTDRLFAIAPVASLQVCAMIHEYERTYPLCR